MSPTFFSNPTEFRNWLEENYQTESELLVAYYKVKTGKASMTWSESVDQALCFGWIDGVRRSIDEESYSIRFTPRKKTSVWSAINIQKIADLTEAGLMKEAGLEAFSLRTEAKSYSYADDIKGAALTQEYQALFKENKSAWGFFKAQAPSYQQAMIHWIMTAKQEKTRLSRLEKVIHQSENGRRIR